MLEKIRENVDLMLMLLAMANYGFSLYAYWRCLTFDALLYALYAIFFAVVTNGIKD